MRSGPYNVCGTYPAVVSSRAFLMYTGCMFKDGNRAVCLDGFLRKALTLLSNSSSSASRCLITRGSGCSRWKMRQKTGLNHVTKTHFSQIYWLKQSPESKSSVHVTIQTLKYLTENIIHFKKEVKKAENTKLM